MPAIEPKIAPDAPAAAPGTPQSNPGIPGSPPGTQFVTPGMTAEDIERIQSNSPRKEDAPPVAPVSPAAEPATSTPAAAPTSPAIGGDDRGTKEPANRDHDRTHRR